MTLSIQHSIADPNTTFFCTWLDNGLEAICTAKMTFYLCQPLCYQIDCFNLSSIANTMSNLKWKKYF